MLIIELTKYTTSPTAQTNVAPFVYQSFPALHTTADYWKIEFAAPDESVETTIFVSSFIQAAVVFYSAMASLADCVVQELSFFFLVLSEILYVHYEHDSNRWSDIYDYGDQLSYNDKKDIYIDNVYCASLLESVPSLDEQQDIQNYDRLALKSGKAVLSNVADPMTMIGRLDDLVTRKLYGNDARVYYLDDFDGVYDYTRSDLVDISAYTIDDYDLSLKQASVDLKDKRGAQDIDIPTEYYSADDYPDIDEKYIGKVVPIGYGYIRASEAIPLNSGAAGDVVYQQASEITILGTVQVMIDDAWVTNVPTATDIEIGQFTLAAADARNASGAPYDCRVLGSTLSPVTYASDIIIGLNQRYLGILYTDSAYDRTEWEAEEISLEPIGILWNEPIKIYDAIAQIQNGANVGFRYEINASGRRTIRIDDNDREPVMHVPNVDIQNIDELPVDSQKELLASVVHVNYGHDYFDDADLFVENDDNSNYILSNYRQRRKTITIDSHLTNSSGADERAAWHAARFRDTPKTLSVELRGKGYYNLRIFDILTIEITPATETDAGTARIISGREYYGFYKAKIVRKNPQPKTITNKVGMLLIEKIESIDYLRATPSGAIRACGKSGTATCKRGVRNA